MECPPHTVISCESASLVHRLLLFYPVHSYIVWDNGKTREIIVRISLLEGTLHRSTDACFRHIPLLTTLEADLKAAGFASATCAFPPPPPIPPSWIPLPPPSVANSEEQQQPPVNWLRFPSDIWKIIFGKLQLVDLLRSRVVCKSWCDLLALAPLHLTIPPPNKEHHYHRSFDLERRVRVGAALSACFPGMLSCKPALQVLSYTTKAPPLTLRKVDVVDCSEITLTNKFIKFLTTRTHIRGLKLASSSSHERFLPPLASALPRLTRLELSGSVHRKELVQFTNLTYLRVDRSYENTFAALSELQNLQVFKLDTQYSMERFEMNEQHFASLQALPLLRVLRLPSISRNVFRLFSTLTTLNSLCYSLTPSSTWTDLCNLLQCIAALRLQKLKIKALRVPSLVNPAVAFFGAGVAKLVLSDSSVYLPAWQRLDFPLSLLVVDRTANSWKSLTKRPLFFLPSSLLHRYTDFTTTPQRLLIWTVDMHNNLKEVFQSEPIVNQDTTKAMEDVRLLQVTEHEAVSLEEFTTKEEKVCAVIRAIHELPQVEQPKAIGWKNGRLFFVYAPKEPVALAATLPLYLRLTQHLSSFNSMHAVHQLGLCFSMRVEEKTKQTAIPQPLLYIDFKRLFLPADSSEQQQQLQKAQRRDVEMMIRHLQLRASVDLELATLPEITAANVAERLQSARNKLMFPWISIPPGLTEVDFTQTIPATPAEQPYLLALLGSSPKGICVSDYLRSRPPSCVSVGGWAMHLYHVASGDPSRKCFHGFISKAEAEKRIKSDTGRYLLRFPDENEFDFEQRPLFVFSYNSNYVMQHLPLSWNPSGVLRVGSDARIVTDHSLAEIPSGLENRIEKWLTGVREYAGRLAAPVPHTLSIPSSSSSSSAAK